MARRSQSGYTFADLVADYERESPRGRFLHSYDKARLLKALGHRRLSDLKEEHFTDFGIAREIAGGRTEIINEELRTLGDIMVWARDVAKKIESYPKIQYMRVVRKEPAQVEIRQSPVQRMLDRGPLFSRFGHVGAPERPVAVRRPRTERWSDAAVAEHLKQHPINKLNRDGSRFSDQQRADAIEKEQSIKIDRTTVARRLRPYRPAS